MLSKSSALNDIDIARERYVIPDWQRGEVWDTPKKQLLIDSILLGWKLPKFYFARVANDDDRFEVVDGQQRFASIRDFIDNKFPLSPATMRAFNLSGAGYYKNLPPHISRAFRNFILEYDEISDASPRDKKEFFQRLQQGMPLINSEKLNALHSGLRDYSLSLTKHEFFQSRLPFQDTRHAFFDIASKVIAVAVDGLKTNLLSDGIRDLFQTHSDFDPPLPMTEHFKATLDFLVRAFPGRTNLLSNRSLVQSVITLASQFIAGGKSEGHEVEFGEFIGAFSIGLSQQGKPGQADTVPEYVEFSRSAKENVPAKAEIRQRALTRMMRERKPDMALLLAPDGDAKSWVPSMTDMAAFAPIPPSTDSAPISKQPVKSGKSTMLAMTMRSTSSSISDIYETRDRRVIADWQRGEVWSTPKKQLLIDSILEGWKLPKFYFTHSEESDGPSEVVDGQQRLAAIIGFISNDFPLSPQTARKFDLSPKTYYKDLPPNLSAAIVNYTIEIDEIYGAPQKELREFFQRLQQGMPLAGREKLNAVHSGLRDYCALLAQHEFFTSSTSLSLKRHAFFDVAFKVAAIEIRGIEASLKYKGIKELFESNTDFSPASPIAQHLNATFDFLSKALPTKIEELHNRSITQSIITLASQFVATGRSGGREVEFGEFIREFLAQYTQQTRRLRDATDADYIEFKYTISADLVKNARIRHEVLIKKMRALAPALAAVLETSDEAQIPDGIKGSPLASIEGVVVTSTRQPPAVRASFQREQRPVVVRAPKPAKAPVKKVDSFAVVQRALLNAASQRISSRLDHTEFAQKNLQPLLEAYASLNPPITTYQELSARLEAIGEEHAASNVRRIFSGDMPILLLAGNGAGARRFSRDALALVTVSGKTSREVFADLIKAEAVTLVESASNGSAKEASASLVTWADFARVVPTLAKRLQSEKGIDSTTRILDLIRTYWTNEALFYSSIAELIASKQPYDWSSGRLKPLVSTIALAFSSSARNDQLFPEYDKARIQFEADVKERRETLVALVAKYYVAHEGKAEEHNAPAFIDAQKAVRISQPFTQYLLKHLPGVGARKVPIARGYTNVLESEASFMRNGALTAEASGLLKLLKVPQAEIDALAATTTAKKPLAKLLAKEERPAGAN